MKILYLSNVSIFEKSGVLSKINDQIDAWTDLGCEVYFSFFPVRKVDESRGSSLTPRAKDIFYAINEVLAKRLPGPVFNIMNKWVMAKKYKRYIDSLQPDIVYMREMVAFPGLYTIIKNKKVVLESNTVLRLEKESKYGVMWNSIKKMQHRVNKQMSGFVAVTNEIIKEYKPYLKPTVVISNGIKIDVNSLEKIRALPKQNKRKQLVLLCSDTHAWHGIDKYESMARLLPEFDFHLVGIKRITTLSNFYSYSYMDKQALKTLLSGMDIGVGSLALHRKQMDEACPLKVREYGTYLLPMILAYHDTDFHGKPYVLEIDNTETTIEDNLSRIRAFIEEWSERKTPVDEIYQLISSDVKERQRVAFFEKIAKQ